MIIFFCSNLCVVPDFWIPAHISVFWYCVHWLLFPPVGQTIVKVELCRLRIETSLSCAWAKINPSTKKPQNKLKQVHKIDSAVLAFVRRHTNITPLYLAYLFDLHDKHQPIGRSSCIDWKLCEPHSLGFLYRPPKKFKITWKQQIIWGWLAGKDETVMGLKCNGGTTEKDIKIKEVFPLGSMNMLSKSDVILVTVLEGILWGVWMCFGNTMTVCMLVFLCHSKKGFILCESWLSVPNFKEICTAVVEIFFFGWSKVLQGLQPANHVTSASSGLAVSRTINKPLIWRFMHLLLSWALIS